MVRYYYFFNYLCVKLDCWLNCSKPGGNNFTHSKILSIFYVFVLTSIFANLKQNLIQHYFIKNACC